MRAILVACLTSSGCTPPLFDAACAIQCGERQECPAGATCASDGFCHRAGEPARCDRDPVLSPDAARGPGAPGTGTDADIGDDGDAAPPRGPFGEPVLIAAVSNPSAAEDDPTLTADQLELYFDSDRLGSGDIWVSRRASIDAPWGAPTRVSELSTASDETTPEIVADGLTIYFSSTRPGGLGREDVWMATRSGRSQPWSQPVHVSALSSPAGEYGPAPAPSHRHLVLASNRDADGVDLDLYETSRPSASAPWSQPVLLSSVSSTTHDESNPILLRDDSELVFNSRRPGGSGGHDLWTAESTAGAFGAPVPVSELNTGADEEDPWLSEDGRTIVFASSRSGDLELYESRR